tara:strand:- start:535 stop:1476 length:942 start_codon:yes stop_codon:yes gene_type:complete
MMKKINFILILLFIPAIIFGQNMKPTIMVIPSDIYMTKKGWVDEKGNNDFQKAFKNDVELRLAVAQLGEFMGKQGFPLVNLEAQLKGLQNEQIRNENYESRDGETIQLTILDEIFASTQPDIVMDLDFQVSGGMKKTLLYNLQGLDSYTFKLISSSSGTGPGSATGDIATLLQVAIKDNMDNFCLQLTDHFHSVMEKGREIKIQIKVNSDDIYFDDDYFYPAFDDMDDELSIIIEEWFYRNAKNGMFKVTSLSDKRMKVDEIRVPVVDDRGRAITAMSFVRKLKKILKREPFNIPCDDQLIGLGEAWLILGNK